MLTTFLTRKFLLLLTLVTSITMEGNNKHIPIASKDKVLIFSKTNGFRHQSIPAGIAAISAVLLP